MFTGLMPHEHGATSQTRRLRADVHTLAEQLSEQGYETVQITANPVTTGIFGLDRGFQQVHKIWHMVQPRFKKTMRFLLLLAKPRVRRLLTSKDALAQQLSEDLEVGNCWFQNTHQDIFDKARSVIAENEARGKRTFLFINLMETHFPYHVAPTFRLTTTRFDDRLGELQGLFHVLNQSFLKRNEEVIGPRIRRVLRRRQERSWRLVRRRLSGLLRDLHEDKENLVVFCSDHGDNFGEQGWYYHFSNVTDAGNRIPLFWLGHDHPDPAVIQRPVSSRFIHNSILDACELPHGPGTLFSEEPETVPVMQSYWYDNQGKTLPKYRFNQLCFVEDSMRYLLRNDNWYVAPVPTKRREPDFQLLETAFDPVEEAVEDSARRQYLRETVRDFRTFSAYVGTGR
jgi:hypothetical protein